MISAMPPSYTDAKGQPPHGALSQSANQVVPGSYQVRKVALLDKHTTSCACHTSSHQHITVPCMLTKQNMPHRTIPPHPHKVMHTQHDALAQYGGPHNTKGRTTVTHLATCLRSIVKQRRSQHPHRQNDVKVPSPSILTLTWPPQKQPS